MIGAEALFGKLRGPLECFHGFVRTSVVCERRSQLARGRSQELEIRLGGRTLERFNLRNGLFHVVILLLIQLEVDQPRERFRLESFIPRGGSQGNGRLRGRLGLGRLALFSLRLR